MASATKELVKNEIGKESSDIRKLIGKIDKCLSSVSKITDDILLEKKGKLTKTINSKQKRVYVSRDPISVSIIDLLSIITSGQASNGFGASFNYQLEDSGGKLRDVVCIEVKWADSLTSSYCSQYVFKLSANGSDPKSVLMISGSSIMAGVTCDFASGIRTLLKISSVTSNPTSSDLNSSFGDNVGDRFVGLLGSDSGTTTWLCVSNDNSWSYLQLNKAI